MATNISVRDIEFDLDASRVADWNAGFARTVLWNALSIMFPHGERFFIQAVAAFREGIDDPVLAASIRGFVAQEALHTREHLAYNAALQSCVDAAKLDAEVAAHIDFVKSGHGALEQLAVTCALEHFTAIMARAVLNDPAYFAGAEPSFGRLWNWHALEECEHKSVAFDVFEHVTRGNGYGLRVRSMLMATELFVRFAAKHTVKIMQSNALVRSPQAWLAVLGYIFVRPGLARRILLPYLRYYAPGFHPDHIYDRRVLEVARSLIEAVA